MSLPGPGTVPGFWRQFLASQRSESKRILAELLALRGLMPLLMKHRNGGEWSPEERAELLLQMRRLSRISPALLLLLLPGSALLLPLYAWWLDRRRGARDAGTGGSA
jgi:hypothetical protein